MDAVAAETKQKAPALGTSPTAGTAYASAARALEAACSSASSQPPSPQTSYASASRASGQTTHASRASGQTTYASWSRPAAWTSTSAKTAHAPRRTAAIWTAVGIRRPSAPAPSSVHPFMAVRMIVRPVPCSSDHAGR